MYGSGSVSVDTSEVCRALMDYGGTRERDGVVLHMCVRVHVCVRVCLRVGTWVCTYECICVRFRITEGVPVPYGQEVWRKRRSPFEDWTGGGTIRARRVPLKGQERVDTRRENSRPVSPTVRIRPEVEPGSRRTSDLTVYLTRTSLHSSPLSFSPRISLLKFT